VDKHFLIVGLGNPGLKYRNTRHNFGFMTADLLAQRLNALPWKEKFTAETARGSIGDAVVTIIKPLTFMNLSGRSTVRAMQFFNVEIANLIVIHDELDLDFGMVRLKNGGGCAGHKGLLSIKQETGNADYLRVRMGIGRPQHGSGADYVLSNFSTDEAAVLGDVVQKGADAVIALIEDGVAKAMNAFNRRVGPVEAGP
jgi:PTH1 family peptidyl-tRNA hydrolase